MTIRWAREKLWSISRGGVRSLVLREGGREVVGG